MKKYNTASIILLHICLAQPIHTTNHSVWLQNLLKFFKFICDFLFRYLGLFISVDGFEQGLKSRHFPSCNLYLIFVWVSLMHHNITLFTSHNFCILYILFFIKFYVVSPKKEVFYLIRCIHV